ncbi:hypothetical protein CEXT_603831 [Caerostris extrusa]|uniref:Uncharacterized protein n=1 Tax=Caerostris extrusa TaxID=172846 RepID=A0AAV4SWL6_CAEEX|nr:hypothetical protein CEXT_603831 [Caerostris extrusa]
MFIVTPDERCCCCCRRHLAHGGDPGHRGFAPLSRHARAEHQERQGFPAGVLRGQPAVVQGGAHLFSLIQEIRGSTSIGHLSFYMRNWIPEITKQLAH